MLTARIEGMSEKEINIFYEDAKPKDVLAEVEERPGIYVIVGKNIKYPYPNGDSKVIYIGTSDCELPLFVDFPYTTARNCESSLEWLAPLWPLP